MTSWSYSTPPRVLRITLRSSTASHSTTSGCYVRSIRHSLTMDSCHSLVRALIDSKLDYLNGLLGGAPAFLLDRLSSVICCCKGRSTTSKNEPHNGRDERTATLTRFSSTSRLQAVRPCVSVPPWFCPTLLSEMLRSCHPRTIGSALCNCSEGQTRRPKN